MANNLATTWRVVSTLLACPPGYDVNQRFIYRGDEQKAIFNVNMRVWDVWKDEALKRACDELNKIEEADVLAVKAKI